MSEDSIKTNAEIVAEKLAKSDNGQASIHMAPKGPTVLEQLVFEVNDTDEVIKKAVRKNIIKADAARVLFAQIVQFLVYSQYTEMQKEKQADLAIKEQMERDKQRQMEKSAFEVPNHVV